MAYRSKTLKMIEDYEKLLREQGEEQQVDPNAQAGQESPPVPTEDVMPLTSQDEDQYISNIVDAALFAPSPEEAKTLRNLQSVMQMKRYKNSREEILPMVLSIISPKSAEGSLKKDLNEIPE